MKLLVDTSVWSLALRRKELDEKEHRIVEILSNHINNGEVYIIGPIRQELLSGIKDRKQFLSLQKHLTYFEELPIHSPIYEKAAEFYNKCRNSGIQGSHIDFLICAVAHEYDLQIFTLDKDFSIYSKVLTIKIYPID